MKSVFLLRKGRLAGFIAIGVLLFGGGCRPLRRYAMGQVANVLAESTDSFHADDDPDLIRESLPFALKLMEGTLLETPNHQKLLLHLCSGFTEYAYGFVKQDAEEIEDDDFEKAEALRLRCKKMLIRARGYGLRGLEVGYPGIGAMLKADPKKAVKRIRKKDVGFAYWLGACWGAAISIDKNDTELMADQEIVMALLDHVMYLDEAFDAGAIHDIMISYEMARMDSPGKPAARARRHFERAVKLSLGQLASPYVNYAESVCVQQQNKAEFTQMLKKALAVDIEARPDSRVINLVMQRRAKWLLSRIDDLFLE